MCGRFAQFLELEDIVEALELSNLYKSTNRLYPDSFANSFNASPGQQATITWVADGVTQFSSSVFGRQLHSVEPKMKAKYVFNARVESVFQKRLFKNSITSARCVLFVNGYYEWRSEKIAGGVSKLRKRAFFIKSSNSNTLALAGILVGTGPIDKEFALLTRDAGNDVRDIHSRQPVTLSLEAVGKYLHTVKFTPEQLQDTAYHQGQSLMSYEVSDQVNSSSRQGSTLIYPRVDDTTYSVQEGLF